MPTPRSPKYDEAAHAERVRKLLAKRIETLPLAALVTLQEAAAILAEGGQLDTLAARERLGKRRPGAVQVQPRSGIETGDTLTAKVMAKNAAQEEAELGRILEAIRARRWPKNSKGS